MDGDSRASVFFILHEIIRRMGGPRADHGHAGPPGTAAIILAACCTPAVRYSNQEYPNRYQVPQCQVPVGTHKGSAVRAADAAGYKLA